ncbi:hypothetical protein N0V95_010041, partial [Ascochyta clinopodiicola]
MLGSEYPWLFDCDASQQVPDYLVDAGTYACTDGGDMSAGFDPSSVAQKPSTASTAQLNSNQQPSWLDDTALSIDQDFGFASLVTDVNFLAPSQDLNPAVIGQDVGSLKAYQDHTSVHQDTDAELFYHSAQSPLVHQYVDPAVVSQGANLYDTSAALAMQHVPDPTLREELERWLLEESPCVLEYGAGLETEPAADFGTQPGIEFGDANEGPQLRREQPQQDRRYEHVEPLADTTERLNKQDERIRELELVLQQLQQLRQASPELPQNFIDIPRQWVEVQTNFEQYFERFINWAEEQSQVKARDTLGIRGRVEELEAE